MLINYETSKSVEEVKERLEQAAKSKGFGVMAVHDVSSVLESKGVPIKYRCLIMEVCSPKHASKVLSEDPYIATALPCRIAIFQENGKTVVSTMAPTEVLSLFERDDLEDLAYEVERMLEEIMEESL